MHNENATCWNCPAAEFQANVDFRSCGQSSEQVDQSDRDGVMISCQRRPELGMFSPNIRFSECPEWEKGKYGYKLKDMRVMILGIDGYLGWTLALKLAKLGFDVYGVDAGIRRKAVKEKGTQSIVPIESMKKRIEAANRELGVNINYRELNILHQEDLRGYMKEVEPESIVHYAELPSAPYSMVSPNHARFVQENNILGSLGVLYAIKDIVPEASLVKLGTMGELGSPLTGRPLFEGTFPADATLKWDDREWSLGGELTPRSPPSFYHAAKTADTYNVWEACKYWWLRSYDIMQGVIYGVHTDEVAKHPELRTRLDVDELFGTVINRFAAQAVKGMPLSVYGAGNQIRGFIGLGDAMQSMVRLISHPPEPGQYETVNQISGVYKVKDLAETVATIADNEFNLDPKIQRVENPRVEADTHPMEAVAKKLPGKYNLEPKIEPEEEIYRMIKLLLDYKERIDPEVIDPKTTWSGEKKEHKVLEEYKPGGGSSGPNMTQTLNSVEGSGEDLFEILRG